MRDKSSPNSIRFVKEHGIPVGHLRTIQQFSNFIVEFGGKETTLYRGQRSDEPLLPKIARIRPALLRTHDVGSRESKIRLAAERSVLKTFKREAVSYLNPEPTTEWRWLTIARHHELPTRLLDWSENPLIALWFAVNKPAKRRKPGVLWQFNPDGQDFIDDTSKDKDPFRYRRPIVLQPSHFVDRVRAQASVFTVHNYARHGKITPFEKLRNNRGRLRKLLIGPEFFPYLRYGLDQLGINEGVIFQDLTGLCRRIDWQASFHDDEEGKFKWDPKTEEWLVIRETLKKLLPDTAKDDTHKNRNRPRRSAPAKKRRK